ncbi:effector-binding domain-containing protein [Kribbella antiqua]|uniref:Effector-binding domain-containing protein n=1 Tax=Kribbella antiqua TaxID=2512217 RepID=A0A4R2IPM2_9ACTN|nr:GyrI-like domain-containing protein [Kribbella antiqua]TCO47133.1 effector-binding domain-containing protein [Kribbella antiqua]
MRTESRTVQEQPTAVLRAILRQDEVSGWVLAAFDAVADYLRRHGIAPCGFPFARYHILTGGDFDVEAGFPVAVRISGDNHVRPSSLPGGHVVVARHVGPSEQLGDAYQAVDDWLRAECGTRAGDAWEVYHDLPHRPRNTRTEVVQPFSLETVSQVGRN